MTTSPNTGVRATDATVASTLAPDEQEAGAPSSDARARDTRPVQAISPDVDPAVASDEDDAATVLRHSVRPETPSRSRKNTLAMAITRPVRSEERVADAPPEGDGSQATAVEPRTEAATAAGNVAKGVTFAQQGSHDASEEAGSGETESDEVADEVDELDEWALADQPTVYLSPRKPAAPTRPAFLETGESQTWPPRPARAEPPLRRPASSSQPRAGARGQTPSRPAPAPESGASPHGARRLATPSGNVMPGTPPDGVPRAALPNPRMQRFQELRGQRSTSDEHERLHQEPRPVAAVVRQWWNDLLPGLEGALHYQREAKASGIHPLPAYEPAAASRLGDAFGRIAASARDLTGRAQAAAAPTLKRLHAQAEQAAQAFVEKFEGSPARQQFPLLGPGRIAVFFKQGVTVGQAQKLLAASQARPIRLIPRKHGFLTLVPPGAEAEVAERLRVHPYVRDVAYLEYDEYGQPMRPER